MCSPLSYQLLQADMVTLFLVDPIKQELWMAVSKVRLHCFFVCCCFVVVSFCAGAASAKQKQNANTCLVMQDMAGHRIPLGRGIVGHVAVTGQVVNVADAYEDARFDPSNDAKSGVRTKGVLCVPVCVTQGKPIAVIEAVTIEGVHVNGTSSGKTAFDDADVEALTAFSAEVALALNRKSVEAAFMKVRMHCMGDTAAEALGYLVGSLCVVSCMSGASRWEEYSRARVRRVTLDAVLGQENVCKVAHIRTLPDDKLCCRSVCRDACSCLWVVVTCAHRSGLRLYKPSSPSAGRC